MFGRKERVATLACLVGVGVVVTLLMTGSRSGDPAPASAAEQVDVPQGVASGSDGKFEEPDKEHFGFMPRAVRARIISDPDPMLFNEYDLSPIGNAWRAGSRDEYTWVFAGRAGRPLDTTTGRLLVFHKHYHRAYAPTQSSEQVDVAGGGTLRIISAPEGSQSLRWAQRRGRIHFAGSTGVSGILNLRDNTVSLEP